MCSGGGNTEGMLMEQSRQSRISKIKSKQKANLSAVNVVTGGGVTDYRRSMSTGAKDIGMTKASLESKKMSDIFSKNIGKSLRLADARKKKEKLDASLRNLFTGGGDGGNAGGLGDNAPG